MTPSYPDIGQGRCKCGAAKSLKFKWKDQPISHPSLFWGCVKYTASDRILYDAAKSCSDSVWIALNKYPITITIKDCHALLDKCSNLHTVWIQREEASTTDLDLYTKVGNNKCYHSAQQNKCVLR